MSEASWQSWRSSSTTRIFFLAGTLLPSLRAGARHGGVAAVGHVGAAAEGLGPGVELAGQGADLAGVDEVPLPGAHDDQGDADERVPDGLALAALALDVAQLLVGVVVEVRHHAVELGDDLLADGLHLVRVD